MFQNSIITKLLFLSNGLMIVGGLFVLCSFLGLVDGLFGNIILGFGTILTVSVGIFTAVINSRMRREIATASHVAGLFSEGNIPFDFPQTSPVMSSMGNLSSYLLEKKEAIDRIANHDLSVETSIRSEYDDFGRSFQAMTDKLRSIVRNDGERDALQQSIMKLLDEVSDVAEGDLTVEAEVSTEMTGAIADAFNYMTAELRSLIRQVKEVTLQVSSSANDISETTAELALGSETQASQISKTKSAFEIMTSQIVEVSTNAAMSAKVADDSLNTARYGSKAVQDNIIAMNGIRNGVQETAKRIKKLGERSQEISQIVQLIDDLSERTSLLALNASLQAAAAGESGRGFVVVAEEVERLAERSNRATQQIAGLTQAIQFETKEVVASMEETIHEVVVGSALADKAGQALVEIEQVSQKLAKLIESISESAQRQAGSSEDVSKAMINVSRVTEMVNSSSKKAAESMKTLVFLADALRTSVAPFKLPEEKAGKIKKFSLPDSPRSGFYLN
jgi:twitching motility protein PilJ